MPRAEPWARKAAIDVHDLTAPYFVNEYRDPEGHFESAFRYGRWLIDRMWREAAGRALGSRDAEALDIGCGIGVHLRQLVSAGYSATGIEPSAEMRAEGQARIGAGRIGDGSVLDLPFADGRFAFAYAIEVLRYLDGADNRKGHAEIARVLRPGGTYFGTYVNRFALDGFLQLTRLRQLRHALGGPAPRCHVEFETPGGLRRKLLAAGFSEVRITGAMFAPLRPIYKAAPAVGRRVAALTSPREALLSDSALTRPFAGHLIAIARK